MEHAHLTSTVEVPAKDLQTAASELILLSLAVAAVNAASGEYLGKFATECYARPEQFSTTDLIVVTSVVADRLERLEL